MSQEHPEEVLSRVFGPQMANFLILERNSVTPATYLLDFHKATDDMQDTTKQVTTKKEKKRGKKCWPCPKPDCSSVLASKSNLGCHQEVR